MRIIKLSAIICATLLIQCATKKEAFYIPPELSAADKIELAEKIKLGRKQYLINCSKCHGKSYSSMDGRPKFTEAQIKNYQVFMKIRNETHSFTTKMNSEDLDNVVIYLKYKK